MGYCDSWRAEFRLANFGLTYQQPSHFLRSQWCNTRTCGAWLYVIYRLLVTSYFWVLIVLSGVVPYNWYNDEGDRIKWFIYLTNWSYLLLTFTTTLQTVTAAWALARLQHGHRYDELVAVMPWWLKLQWCLDNIATGAAFAVGVGFWVGIQTDGVAVHYVDFNTHGMNMLYVCVNLWVTATPYRLYHAYQSVTYILVYMIFSLIYQKSGGSNAKDAPSIYSAADWSNPGRAVGTYCLMALTALLCWLGVGVVYRLRIALFRALCTQVPGANDECQPLKPGVAAQQYTRSVDTVAEEYTRSVDTVAQDYTRSVDTVAQNNTGGVDGVEIISQKPSYVPCVDNVRSVSPV